MHWDRRCHGRVTNLSGKSGICRHRINLSRKINGLIYCLFFVQRNEAGRKQGNFGMHGKISTGLSTEVVELFSLEQSWTAGQRGGESE